MLGYDDVCCFSSSTNTRNRKVLWEITNQCNLKCGFCHRNIYNDRLEPSYDEVLKILDILKSSNITKIIISGGEPFCRSDIIDILINIKKKGFEVDMCTNATLITLKDIVKLSKVLSEISVSVDSANDEQHDNIRGIKGSWMKSINTIKRMIELGLEVHIISILDEKNIAYLNETVAFFYDLHVHSVSFIGKIPIGQNSNRLLMEDIQYELMEVFKNIRKYYTDFRINTKQVFSNENNICTSGQNVFGISADNILYPCILQRHIKGLNILSENIDTIYNAFNTRYKWVETWSVGNHGCCVGSKSINTRLTR